MKKIAIVITVFLLFASFSATSMFKAGAADYHETTVITVKNGDTLWDIAKKNNFMNDIRKTIYEIERINSIEKSIIQPGQQLVIPIYKN